MSSESEMDAANAEYEKATSKNLSMIILGQQLSAQQEECLWNKILKIAANLSKVFLGLLDVEKDILTLKYSDILANLRLVWMLPIPGRCVN